jgi:2-polyprenyl-3-methyl-5-hydroxy-6-metoxy-1,4-benzoquinol methylase
LITRLPERGQHRSALDLGCGSGAFLGRLSAVGYDVLHGVDADLSQATVAGVRYHQAGLQDADLGLADLRFGLVTAIEVVEHLTNLDRFLTHVRDHLADGGAFLMTTPNVHSLTSRIRFALLDRLAQFDDRGDPTHVTPIVLTCLARALASKGLVIRRTWTYPERHGGLASRRTTAALARLGRLLLPDPLPGDVLCLEIRRAHT